MRTGEDPLILSIDSSTETSSVAVVRGSQTLALCTGEPSVQHSSRMLADIDAALQDASVALENIDLFAVASGPGSFTGLRAGLATTKSFAATLGRMVVGVPTLHAVASWEGFSASHVIAAIPAGRGELFAQLLSVRDGRIVELQPPTHVAPEILLDRAVKLGTSIIWRGGGAHKIAGLLRERAARESIKTSESNGAPMSAGVEWYVSRPASALAEGVASLARLALDEGRAVHARDLSAIYVRPSDAELNEKCPTPNSSPK